MGFAATGAGWNAIPASITLTLCFRPVIICCGERTAEAVRCITLSWRVGAATPADTRPVGNRTLPLPNSENRRNGAVYAIHKSKPCRANRVEHAVERSTAWPEPGEDQPADERQPALEQHRAGGGEHQDERQLSGRPEARRRCPALVLQRIPETRRVLFGDAGQRPGVQAGAVGANDHAGIEPRDETQQGLLGTVTLAIRVRSFARHRPGALV